MKNEKREGASILVRSVKSKITRMMRDGDRIQGLDLMVWLNKWAARSKKKAGGL